MFVSGGSDYMLKLWRVGTGELLHTFSGHSGFIYSVMFSPDDQFIVSGCQDRTVKVWKVCSRSLVTTFNTGDAYTQAAFSPTGAHLAVRTSKELIILSLL